MHLDTYKKLKPLPHCMRILFQMMSDGGPHLRETTCDADNCLDLVDLLSASNMDYQAACTMGAPVDLCAEGGDPESGPGE